MNGPDSSPGVEAAAFVAPEQVSPELPKTDWAKREENFNGRTPREQVEDAVVAISKSEDSFSSSPDGQLIVALSRTRNEKAIVVGLGVMEETLRAQKNPDAQNIRIARRAISERVTIAVGSKSAPLSELETELEGLSIDETRIGELEAELAKSDLDETTRTELEAELKGISDVKNRRDVINRAIREGLSTQAILKEVASGVASGSKDSVNGNNLKDVLQAINASRDQVPGAREAYSQIGENTLITFDGRLYCLSDLQSEKASATPERAIEIDKIIKEGTYERSLEVGERLVDQAVEEQVASLTGKIAEAEKAGRDVRKEKEILGRLKGLTGGQARNAIAISAFRQLQKMGVEGLDTVIAQGAGLEAVSLSRIIDTLKANNYPDIQIRDSLLPAILNGNVQALYEGNVLGKPGVDLLFFERSLSDAELQERLKSLYPVEAEALWKKHGKNAAMMILILIAMGVVPSAKKMLIPGS